MTLVREYTSFCDSLEHAVRRWLFDMIGYDVGDNLFEALGDGVILCSICNTIRPGSIAKINPAPKVAFKKMENINNFLAAAKRLMVPSSCLFDTIDLVQQANTAKVTKCLLALAEVAARAGKGIKRTGEKKAADIDLDENEVVILAPGAEAPASKVDMAIAITDADLEEYLARDEDEEAALMEAEAIRKSEESKIETRKRGETLKKEEEKKRDEAEEQRKKERDDTERKREEDERRMKADEEARRRKDDRRKDDDERQKRQEEEEEERKKNEAQRKKADEDRAQKDIEVRRANEREAQKIAEEEKAKEAANKKDEVARKKKEDDDRKAREAEERKERLEKIRKEREAIEERKKKVQRDKDEFERLKAEGKTVEEIRRIQAAATLPEEEKKKAQEEEERKRKTEEERKRKEERDAEEKRNREEGERHAREESDEKRAKEETDRKKKEEDDNRQKAEEEKKRKEEEDATKAKEAHRKKKEEEEERKRKEEDDRKRKEEDKKNEERKKKDDEDKQKQEEERKAKLEADRKAKEEADRKAKEASTPSWANKQLKPSPVTASPPSSPAPATASAPKKAAARFGSSYVTPAPSAVTAEISTSPTPTTAAKQKANRFQSAYVGAAPASPTPAPTAAPAAVSSSGSLAKIDKEAVLVWCQQGTFAHDVVVRDLSASWCDGLAFCALISTHKPATLDLTKARGLATPGQRLAMAFEALAGFGVPSLLDPMDFPTDENVIVTYLSLIQKAFGASADDVAAENDWPAAVRDFKNRFEDFDVRFGKLTDQDIVSGQGVAMNNELNAMFPELKRLKDDYWPEELRHVIQRFNDLRKLLPARVNDVFSKANTQRAASAKAASGPEDGTCAKCNKPLSGETVEAAGCNWHRACFSCQDCGRKLVNSCLNIGNKPYCEQCGKSAFIKAMRKK